MQTTNAKVLIASNVFAQLLAKAVSVLLTFLSTFYIIRLGGPELFGNLTKSLALIAIGFTAIDFGLNAEAVRSMQGSFVSQRKILLQTILVRLFLSVLVVLVLNVVISLLPGGYTPEIKKVFWVGSLAILFQGLYTSANVWFQRRLSYWKTSISTIVGTSVGTLITYFVVISSPSLFHLLAASSLGYLVMGVLSLVLLRPLPLSKKLLASALHSSFSLLKRALPLGLVLLASILASKIDTIILGILRPSSEVGQYGFAYRIFDVALVLPTFVMNVVYPLLVEGNATRKKHLVISSSFGLGGLALLGVIVLYLLAPFLLLVRPELSLSVSNLRFLSLSLPLFYLTAPLMWFLIERRLEKPLLLVYLIAASFNGLTNFLLVPSYGSHASALLTGATELIILIGLLVIRRRYLIKHV